MASSFRKYSTISLAPFSIFPWIAILSFFCIGAILLYKVDDFVSRTKTIVGHNLDPTPWHPFPQKIFNEDTKYARASKIIQCSYLTCRRGSTIEQKPFQFSSPTANCPSFFRWIHHDLEPWSRSRISVSTLMEAQKLAAFRIVIVGGKLYVDFYYACVQSRAMFTVWGLLQLLQRYPGAVPDVDLMFDCMDKPVINRTEYGQGTRWPPPPLFRYCTTEGHFDIPFPDWSFWGWTEVNVRPWDDEFSDIKRGSQVLSWKKKTPRAYWKGNPNVFASIRTELLTCNHSRKWGAQIMRQDWFEEARAGYERSKLSNQCNHRYKIYAEGYAWSVSLKYILSCGSVALIISPQYEDFFSRGLVPRENYWPISTTNLCQSIKFAVDWGNANPSEAEAIGKRGQLFMENLALDQVYDYMYHLITEYSKLQDFTPSPPSSSQEVCTESLLCYAEEKERQFLEMSATSPASTLPCTLQNADPHVIESWVKRKRAIISSVRDLEKV
ncbi:protein O-glucosyltransferase 1 [Telopea speciosissima]|uniref:protein O-glucosyltransferase 1 n=1 Tax=Telopea speciosissima TaxID=54955 RepID=UPI001CC3B132|nr:protein O-glucosyltransferase 1 [Telopea speciosissima]